VGTATQPADLGFGGGGSRSPKVGGSNPPRNQPFFPINLDRSTPAERPRVSYVWFDFQAAADRPDDGWSEEGAAPVETEIRRPTYRLQTQYGSASTLDRASAVDPPDRGRATAAAFDASDHRHRRRVHHLWGVDLGRQIPRVPS